MTIPARLPPIVERELRVASRRGGTYWSRVGAAAAGTFIFFWLSTAQLAVMPTALAGQIIFRLLAGVSAFAVVGSVLQLSSEAFAREKREDTLGLLFLTPLKPIDIVVGKLVSTSLLSFYRFIAIIPLLGLPILMGGVTVKDYLLLVLALANLVFLGSTVGLYVSARTWDEKRAGTIATIIMVGLSVFFPAIVVGIAATLDLQWRQAMSLLAVSPVFSVGQAMIPRSAGTWPWWASLLWTHILGWIFFRAACRTLPLCWQKRPDNAAPRGEHLREQQNEKTPRQFSPPAQEAVTRIHRSVRRQFAAHHRAQLLDQNPILWLALRRQPYSAAAWIVGAVSLIGCVAAFMIGGLRGLLTPGLALFVFFYLNAAFKIFVAGQASIAYSRDRGENILELLLSTPLKSGHLNHGHLLAMRETLGPWIRRIFWIESVWLTLTITNHALSDGEKPWFYALAALAMLGFLIPDIYAVGWAALWQGVINSTSRDAEREAVKQVLFLPWFLAIFTCILPMMFLEFAERVALFTVTWIVCSAAANWWFGKRAFRNLHTQLGSWALRRSSGELENYDGWRRAGRWLGRWWRRQAAPNAAIASSRTTS